MNPVTSNIDPKIICGLNSTPSKKNSKTKFRNDFFFIEKLNKTNNTNCISKKNKIPLCFTLLTNKKNKINDLKFKFKKESQEKKEKDYKYSLEQQPSFVKKEKINLSEFRNKSNPIMIKNDTQNKIFSGGGRSPNLVSNRNQSQSVSFIFNLLNKNFSSFFNNLSPKDINSNNNSNNNSNLFNSNSIINSSNIHININNNISAKKIFPKINNMKQLGNKKMRKFLVNNKFNGVSRNDNEIFPLDTYFINDNKKKDNKKYVSLNDNSDTNISKKSKNFKFSKWNTIDKNNSNNESNILSTLRDKNFEQNEIIEEKVNIKNINQYKKDKKNIQNDQKIKLNKNLKKKLNNIELLSKIEKLINENGQYIVLRKSDLLINKKKYKNSSSEESDDNTLKLYNNKKNKKAPDVMNLLSNLSPIAKEENIKNSTFKNETKKIIETNNVNNKRIQKINSIKKDSSEKLEFVLDLSGTELSKDSDKNIKTTKYQNSLFFNKDENNQNNQNNQNSNLKPENNLESTQMSNDLIQKSKKFFMKRKSLCGMRIKNKIPKKLSKSNTLMNVLPKRWSTTLKKLLSNCEKRKKRKNLTVFRMKYTMFNSKKKENEIYSHNNLLNKLNDRIFIQQKEIDKEAVNLGIGNQEISKENKMNQIILSNKKRMLNMETKSLILALRKRKKELNNKKKYFNTNSDIQNVYKNFSKEIIDKFRIEENEILSYNIVQNLNVKYFYGSHCYFIARGSLNKCTARYLNKKSNFKGFSLIDSSIKQESEKNIDRNDNVTFKITKSEVFINKYKNLGKNWQNIIIYILPMFELLFRTVLNFDYNFNNIRNLDSSLSNNSSFKNFISSKNIINKNKLFEIPTYNKNIQGFNPLNKNQKIKNSKLLSLLKNKNFFFSEQKKNKNNKTKNKLEYPFDGPLNYLRNQDIYKGLLMIISKREDKLFINQFKTFENDIVIDHQFQDGNTLLILCAKDGNNALVKFLLESGADPNIQNNQGNTALHFAIGNKDFEIADYLKKYGAQEDIVNLQGNTAWDCLDRFIE